MVEVLQNLDFLKVRACTVSCPPGLFEDFLLLEMRSYRRNQWLVVRTNCSIIVGASIFYTVISFKSPLDRSS